MLYNYSADEIGHCASLLFPPLNNGEQSTSRLKNLISMCRLPPYTTTAPAPAARPCHLGSAALMYNNSKAQVGEV